MKPKLLFSKTVSNLPIYHVPIWQLEARSSSIFQKQRHSVFFSVRAGAAQFSIPYQPDGDPQNVYIYPRKFDFHGLYISPIYKSHQDLALCIFTSIQLDLQINFPPRPDVDPHCFYISTRFPCYAASNYAQLNSLHIFSYRPDVDPHCLTVPQNFHLFCNCPSNNEHCEPLLGWQVLTLRITFCHALKKISHSSFTHSLSAGLAFLNCLQFWIFGKKWRPQTSNKKFACNFAFHPRYIPFKSFQFPF